EYQADLDRLRNELVTLDTQVTQLDERVALSRELVSRLEALEKQVEDTRSRLQRFSVDRARMSSTLDERRSLRTQAQAILARGAEIDKAAAELDAVRRDLELATDKQHQFLPLERAREAAVRELATEQARLESELSQGQR